MTSCDRPRVWVKVPTVRGEAEAYRAGGRSAGARATRSHPARCHRLRRASPRAIPVPPQRERPDTEWDPITPLITLLEVRGHRHACRTREAIAWNTVPGSPKKRSASTDVDSAHSPGLSPAASGYEFNHRTGPGLTQMPGCRIRAAAPPTRETSGSGHRPAAACALHRARPSVRRYGCPRGRGGRTSTSPERLREGAPEEREGPEPQSRWRAMGVDDGYSGKRGCAPAPCRDQRHAANRATNFIFPACRI